MVATNVHRGLPYTTPTSIGKAGSVYIGNGSPTAALIAPKGSLYVKLDAAATTDRLWIATDSVGGWTFFTSNA